MGTRHRVVRKAIGQPAKLRRLSSSHGAGLASCQKCGTSLGDGTGWYLVPRFKSTKLRQSHVESERFSRSYSVPFSTRRSPQTVIEPGNLYGFPTAAKDSCQGRFAIEPTRVMLGRSPIPRALPRAREAIPYESNFILDAKHFRLARM